MANKTLRMPVHKAILVDGRDIEYQGAHPTHWTFGGVDKDGNPDGSPIETIPVAAYLPGKLPEDEFAFDEDPRDAEILKLRELIADLREKAGDKRDADLESLKMEFRAEMDRLMGEKVKDSGSGDDE